MFPGKQLGTTGLESLRGISICCIFKVMRTWSYFGSKSHMVIVTILVTEVHLFLFWGLWISPKDNSEGNESPVSFEKDKHCSLDLLIQMLWLMWPWRPSDCLIGKWMNKIHTQDRKPRDIIFFYPIKSSSVISRKIQFSLLLKPAFQVCSQISSNHGNTWQNNSTDSWVCTLER